MLECVLVLHNIRSAHNVGSMFRTADGAGVSRIILSGYTPGFEGVSGKERQKFVKVSLGAEKSVPSSRVATLDEALQQLKAEGFIILALEQHERAISLFDFHPKPDEKLAVIMGNEVLGVDSTTLDVVDHILHIPMHGIKESLNVSVAAGIALYTLLKH